MAAKSQVDWEAIEPHWRAGIKSSLEIARDYREATGKSVSHTAIFKHFKALGIERESLSSKRVVLNREGDEFDASGYVYVIYLDSPERFYKVGMAKHFDSRFSAHQCSSPFDLCVACAFFVENMRGSERAIHAMFAEKRVRGEWFRLSEGDLRTIAAMSLMV